MATPNFDRQDIGIPRSWIVGTTTGYAQSDSINFTSPVRAVRANAAGVVEMVDQQGGVSAFTMTAGEVIAGDFCRCNDTNTTVTNANLHYVQ